MKYIISTDGMRVSTFTSMKWVDRGNGRHTLYVDGNNVWFNVANEDLFIMKNRVIDAIKRGDTVDLEQIHKDAGIPDFTFTD